MFYMGNTKITLENYTRALAGVDKDVLDCVRSALLDGTDIGKYITKGVDARWLNQVRLALNEGFPEGLLKLPTDALWGARHLHKKGVSLAPLQGYVEQGVGEGGFEVLLGLIADGYSIEQYHFLRMNENLWAILGFAIRTGFDVQELFNGKVYTVEYIKQCLRLMGSGDALSNYTEYDWQLEVLEELANVASKPYYSSIRPYITHTTPLPLVQAYVRVGESGMDVNQALTVGGIGTVHIDWAIQAYEAGLQWVEFLNPELGNSELSQMYTQMKLDSKRGLHVLSLNRK